MNERHWKDGMHGALPDQPRIEWRTERGIHGPEDLVLWVRFGNGGWCKVPQSLAFLEVDFYYENEDVRYPPPRFLGGRYFMRRLDVAATEGWEKATEMNGHERAAKYGTPYRRKPEVDPPQHCPACKQTKSFWRRQSSTTWVCAVCDPVESREIPQEVQP